MLEYEYRRSMQKNELLLRETDAIEEPGFYKEMLLRNHLPGVLPYVQEKEADMLRYCYDVTTKQPVAERYEQEKMTYGQLQKLLHDMVRIIETGREFLIDENDYVIRPECMFYTKDSEQLYLCCYPFLQKNLREQLSELFEYLLGKIDYSDSVVVGFIYELYMRCKQESFSFAELLGVIDREEETSEDTVGETERNHVFFEKRSEEGTKTELSEEATGSLLYEETGYCFQAERKENSIHVTRFPFYLGQEEDEVRGGAGASAGKVQARISARGETVYIEDMKSAKGVFVNGRRLAGNEIQKLNQGDSVMLADRCFRFMRAG